MSIFRKVAMKIRDDFDRNTGLSIRAVRHGNCANLQAARGLQPERGVGAKPSGKSRVIRAQTALPQHFTGRRQDRWQSACSDAGDEGDIGETAPPGINRIVIGRSPEGGEMTQILSLSPHFAGLAAQPDCAILPGEPGAKGDALTHHRCCPCRPCRDRRHFERWFRQGPAACT